MTRRRILLRPTTGIVLSPGLHVVDHIDGKIIDSLKQGDAFAVIDIKEDVVCTWLRIRYGAHGGWVAERNKKRGERYVQLQTDMPAWVRYVPHILALGGFASLIGVIIAVFG